MRLLLNYQHKFSPTPGQRGAALVTSLIFMVLLTLISFTIFNSAVMQGRMAGNVRDRQIAYSAAELAMRDAESYIRNSGRICGGTESNSHDDDSQSCKNGLCYNGSDMRGEKGTGVTACDDDDTTCDDWLSMPVWKQSDKWTNAITYFVSTGRTKKGDDDTPGEAMTYGDISNCPNWSIGDYTEPDAGIPLVSVQPKYLIEYFKKNINEGECFYYRITTQANGARASTQVRLQTVFTPMICKKSAQQ